MGIRGLTSLISKKCPGQLRPFGDYRGAVIAVDTSILLYKFRYGNRNPNSHIMGFMNKCLAYVKNGIVPVFVIDGKPPPEKDLAIQRRHKAKAKIGQRIDSVRERVRSGELTQLQGMGMIDRLERQRVTVTRDHHTESRELLESLGFQVLVSTGEAEELCAHLQKTDQVDYTHSDDTDTLVLGCKKVLRSGTRSGHFTEIVLEDLLKSLGVTFSEFVDMCVLCGCDYCPSRVGHETAHRLIKDHGSIEKVFALDPCPFREPDTEAFLDARKVFGAERDFSYVGNVSSAPPRVDIARTREFLMTKKFPRDFIDGYIAKFIGHTRTRLT